MKGEIFMLRFIKTGWYELSKIEVEVLIGFGLKDPNKINTSTYGILDLYKPNTVKDYNNELYNDVNDWLVGDTDDYKIAQYAYDCSDESLGMFNMLTITQYLIKKGII